MGLGDFISDIFGSKNTSTATAPKVDPKAYQYGGTPGGAKGCTTYRPAGNYDEPIKAAEAEKAADEAEQREQPEACGWDPITGARTGACAEN